MAAIEPSTRTISALSATLCLAGALAFQAEPAAAEFSALAPFTGAPSSPIEARDVEGRALSIGPDGSRATIVHFFASWCEPCREELPALTAFARKHGSQVRLIGVNVAEPASRARTFAARMGFRAPVALDEDKTIANAFKVRGLPATVVLAPGGDAALGAAGQLDWASGALARNVLEFRGR